MQTQRPGLAPGLCSTAVTGGKAPASSSVLHGDASVRPSPSAEPARARKSGDSHGCFRPRQCRERLSRYCRPTGRPVQPCLNPPTTRGRRPHSRRNRPLSSCSSLGNGTKRWHAMRAVDRQQRRLAAYRAPSTRSCHQADFVSPVTNCKACRSLDVCATGFDHRVNCIAAPSNY